MTHPLVDQPRFTRSEWLRGLESVTDHGSDGPVPVEIQAIRQVLGQRDLPECVGDIESEAPYRPE